MSKPLRKKTDYKHWYFYTFIVKVEFVPLFEDGHKFRRFIRKHALCSRYDNELYAEKPRYEFVRELSPLGVYFYHLAVFSDEAFSVMRRDAIRSAWEWGVSNSEVVKHSQAAFNPLFSDGK